jgi:hypothetical protein
VGVWYPVNVKDNGKESSKDENKDKPTHKFVEQRLVGEREKMLGKDNIKMKTTTSNGHTRMALWNER